MNSTDTLWTPVEKNKHQSHTMHENSLRAWREIDMSAREMMVLKAFQTHGPMTDRQVRDRLGFEEMNAVRPRITTLIKYGLLEEDGKVKCEKTGKTVRVCRITETGMQVKP